VNRKDLLALHECRASHLPGDWSWEAFSSYRKGRDLPPERERRRSFDISPGRGFPGRQRRAGEGSPTSEETRCYLSFRRIHSSILTGAGLRKPKRALMRIWGMTASACDPSAKPRNRLAPFRHPGLERIAGEGLAPDAHGSTRLLWLRVKSVDT